MVLVYGAIEAHSFGEKGCIASNKTIAQETGLKEKTVANAVSKLNKLGWVKVQLDKNNHRILIEPSLTIEPPFTVQGTPLHSTVNIEYSNKNTVIENTTNVVLAKAEKKDKYGRLTEINDAFTYWETSMGYKITSKMKMNRFAASNLIKTHTLDGLSRVIQALPVIHAEQYAPAKAKPSDFIELQANWNSVMAYGRSKANKTNIRVTRIN